MISAEDYQPVTTELFVSGDPYPDSDAVFGMRESLIVPFIRNDSKEVAQQLNVSGPFFIVDYDFVLEPT